MESRSKLTMCRLCLSENQCFVNIFELDDWQGFIAAEIIYDLLQFQVSETDGYPHVVCSKCLMKLTDFKLFKECCQNSKVTYDNMFASCESLEEHKSEMVGLVTVKEEPIESSHNEGNVPKDIGGGGLPSCEQDPLREITSDEIIKQEVLDIDPSCGDGSEEAYERTNSEVRFGPILLKHEVLPFNRDTPPQEKSVESVASANVGAVEPAGKSMKDSTQEEGENVTAPEKGIRGRKGMFECYHCKKVLRTKRLLKKHMPLHSKVKPYSCEVCRASFRWKSNLTSHVKLHSGERPHKCKECSKDYTRSYHLKQHMIVVHSRGTQSDLSYQCNHCSKMFSYKQTLTKHLKTVCVGKC